MSTVSAGIHPAPTKIPIDGGAWLDADVAIPSEARGVVLFTHGCGTRQSPCNRYVASELNFLQFGTVLADLMPAREERTDEHSGALSVDIAMLTRRIVQMIDWMESYDIRHLPIGLFGANAGAAAALDAAAARPDLVRAVVSWGGRLDLATRLREVRAAVLLIVGANDTPVLEINRDALRHLTSRKELDVIPGATHLFDEPGTLEAAAAAAGTWVQEHLALPG